MKRLMTCLIVAFSFLLFSNLAAAEEIEVKATLLHDGIYVITGKGGNIGLLSGEDGTFLIDDQFAPLTDKLLESIKSIGASKPKFLINTHYHGDHTGGNENLGKQGTLIFSHDNVRERLSSGSFLQAFNMKMERVAKEGLPVVTFSEDITFHLNGMQVKAIHVPHAHTDGDSFIHFQDANIIHAGDLFFNGFYPFIDVNHGGTLKGLIEGVERILLLSDDSTIIIAGHGPVGDKKMLQEYLEMLNIAYERLNGLKVQGNTADEAIESRPLDDLEEKWGKGLFNGDRWIKIIYSGI